MFSYVISGNGCKAIAVRSELGLFELQDLIRVQSRAVHPESHERVWSWGVIDFVNPVVHTVSDFANFGPALIGV